MSKISTVMLHDNLSVTNVFLDNLRAVFINAISFDY